MWHSGGPCMVITAFSYEISTNDEKTWNVNSEKVGLLWEKIIVIRKTIFNNLQIHVERDPDNLEGYFSLSNLYYPHR